MRQIQLFLVFGLAAASMAAANVKTINWKNLVAQTKTTANECQQMFDLSRHVGGLLLLFGLWLVPPAVLLLLSVALAPADNNQPG